MVAFSREKSGIGGKKGMDQVRADFEGADCRFGDVTNIDNLRAVGFADKVDVVVSCLASRTGGLQDSWDIDYQARSPARRPPPACGVDSIRRRRARTASTASSSRADRTTSSSPPSASRSRSSSSRSSCPRSIALARAARSRSSPKARAATGG